MKNKTEIVSAVVGILLGGLADWFQPYNQHKIWGVNIWLFMSMGAFIVSLAQMIFMQAKPTKIALLVSLGVAIAVLARIIYDTTCWDPTSHNLAPFEIIFAVVATIPTAFVGAYLGFLIKKYLK